MYYEIKLKCPYCSHVDILDPDYPEDCVSYKCPQCKGEFVYSVKVKHKVKYFEEVKK